MPDIQHPPVNRERRFRFVCAVVGFCLGAATLFSGGAGLGWLSHQITLVSVFIDGMIGLATAVTLGYLFGSVIDYNGGVRNTLWKPKAGLDAQRRQPPEPTVSPPWHAPTDPPIASPWHPEEEGAKG